jgi:hypothetical protein
MKKLNLLFVAISSTAAFTASAITNVYDNDGFERSTSFNEGPLHSSQIISSTAHELEIYLYPRGINDTCSYANIYTSMDNEHIASVPVGLVGGSNSVKRLMTAIPEEYLTENKRVVVSCNDALGKGYNIHIKAPGAPIINWQANIEPRGEFVYRSKSYSYHSAYQVHSNLNIDNQNNFAHCKTVNNRDVELGLFHGQEGKGPFHSDIFIANANIDNSIAPQPVVYQVIECENAVGKSRAIKVWELTNESVINLIHDDVTVY